MDIHDGQFCYINNIAININDYKDSMGIPYDANGKKMIIKRGSKRIHHFARKTKNNIKGNKMSDWHKWWQTRVNKEHTEIEYKIKQYWYRADIVNNDGLIIELQKSPINIETIEKRENFYKIGLTQSFLKNFSKNCISELSKIQFRNIIKLPRGMIWIWDCSNIDIIIEEQYNNIICFKWIKGSQFMLDAKERSFLDFNKRGLIEIMGIKKRSTPKIVGKIWSLYEFDKEFLKYCLINNAETRIGYPRYNNKGENTSIDLIKKKYLK